MLFIQKEKINRKPKYHMLLKGYKIIENFKGISFDIDNVYAKEIENGDTISICGGRKYICNHKRYTEGYTTYYKGRFAGRSFSNKEIEFRIEPVYKI